MKKRFWISYITVGIIAVLAVTFPELMSKIFGWAAAILILAIIAFLVAIFWGFLREGIE